MCVSMDTESWLPADWPAPPGVRAGTTTRIGGHSAAPYASFNLADHVGDDPDTVAANRARLRRMLALPGEPCWLAQQHGNRVAAAEYGGIDCDPADAAITSEAGVVCAVLTADCLPLLLCDADGTQVAAVHAGWRGLAAGVVQAAVARFSVPAARLVGWLGPAIGPARYEVGEEVARILSSVHPDAAKDLRPGRPGRWFADLYGLACGILRETGVSRVFGGAHCTYADAERFYSYRREETTGRMATLIWREPTRS